MGVHEIRVYMFVKGQPGWVTAKEIAARTGVAERTARRHVTRFLQARVFDGLQLDGGAGWMYRMGKEQRPDLEAAARVLAEKGGAS
jgi:predicted transcriptional regulator